MYFLGLDGGGTGCRARIEDENGQCFGAAEGELANIYQDFDRAIANIRDCIGRTAAQNGIDLTKVHAVLGLAGAGSPQQSAKVEQAGLPFARLMVDSDGAIACQGAHAGADGGIVIAGTGSAALALVKGQRYQFGSYGFMLADQASASHMGLRALRHALMALDGLRPRCDLSEALLAAFSHDPGQMIDWSRTALSRDYAVFAPQIVDAAEVGNALGAALVADCCASIEILAQRLREAGAERVSLMGGLGQRLADRFAKVSLFQPALETPVHGAIHLAKCHFFGKVDF